MHAGRIRPRRGRRDDSGGFSLVEILIVVVVLGVLATVVVFSVRGVTDRGEENSEATELRNLETAIEAYWARNGDNPADLDELVAAEYFTRRPTLFEYTDHQDGTYTLTNVRTGDTSTRGRSGSASGNPAPSVLPASGETIVYAGVSGFRYGNASLGDNDYDVIIGGATGAGQFDQLVASNSILMGADWIVYVPTSEFTSAADVAQFVSADQAYRDANEGGGSQRILFMNQDDVLGFDGTDSLLDTFWNASALQEVGPGGSWPTLQDRFDP